MNDVTYEGLFEKYAKRSRDRDVVALVMGSLGIIGVVLAALRLRELREDRAAAALIVVKGRSGDDP